MLQHSVDISRGNIRRKDIDKAIFHQGFLSKEDNKYLAGVCKSI
jgi:hypothetical protein